MKILIISYSPFSMSNNGGKLYISLFSAFKSAELCQLYINPRYPDAAYCTSYYHQTERDLINSILKKQNKRHSFSFDSDIAAKALSCRKNTSVKPTVSGTGTSRSLLLLGRDILWKCLPWDSRELNDWIVNEKPDCIFTSVGDSRFLYSISLKLARRYNLPLIAHFSDDYYSIRSKHSPLMSFQLFLLRRKINEFIHKSQKIISLNDFLTNYLKAQFKTEPENKFATIYMGSSADFSVNTEQSTDSSRLKISYLGNLSYGRGDNLLIIAEEIEKYNKCHNTSHTLNIYAKADSEFTERCKLIPSIEYKGFIPGQQVGKAILESDILVHTESFEPKYVNATRFSLSTKIADSLQSGKCLLAYGPAQIASIQHLIANNCAAVATSRGGLTELLDTLLSDADLRNDLGKKALNAAEKIHNTQKNSEQLRKQLLRIVSQSAAI